MSNTQVKTTTIYITAVAYQYGMRLLKTGEADTYETFCKLLPDIRYLPNAMTKEQVYQGVQGVLYITADFVEQVLAQREGQ